MKKALTALLATLLLISLSACTTPQASSAAQTVAPTTVQAATAEPTAAPLASPSPTAGVTEKKTGIISKVYTKDSTNYVDIDYVDMLTGAAAVAKAKEDKSASYFVLADGTEGVDDDYYISNDDKTILTFPLAADCKFQIVDMSSDNVASIDVDFAKFTQATVDRKGMLVSIDVQNGVVKSLAEIYTP